MAFAILRKAWDQYEVGERRNIGIFIVGLMFYKFGLEIFIGSILPLASDRFGENFFDCDDYLNRSVSRRSLETFRKVGVLTGVNQAMQCLGAILVAPLMQRYQTRQVLLGATLVFALLTSILLICDAATGGRPLHWGGYNPVAIFPVYCISGLAYGMIELIRRVLPRELVGGNVEKLKQLDSVVHVFYETAGTIGPITVVRLIDTVGENQSFFLSPVSLALAGLVWFFIRPGEDQPLPEQNHPGNESGFLKRLLQHVAFWGRSTWKGGAIVLRERRFVWLVPCYSFALLAHRYLENNIANIYAKGVIEKASYQPLIIVGSNLGELLGATVVFFTVATIHSPIPFIRLDALLLLLVWVIPYLPASGNKLKGALSMAGLFLPMSGTWAAGDVSLNAYIQSSLANVDVRRPRVSTLASIMSFLYVTYIASYTVLSSLLGLLVDTVIGDDRPCSANYRGDTRTALIYVGGIFFTVISVTMLVSTLLPKGALAWNPNTGDFQVAPQPQPLQAPRLPGAVDVHVVNRSNTPSSLERTDTEDSDAAEQQAQHQNVLPSPTISRPVPSPTNSRPVPSPTNSKPAPSPTNSRPLPFPTNLRPLPSPMNSRPLPSPMNSRPLPSPTNLRSLQSPPLTHGSHGAQDQRSLPSPTHAPPPSSSPSQRHELHDAQHHSFLPLP